MDSDTEVQEEKHVDQLDDAFAYYESVRHAKTRSKKAKIDTR